MRLRSFISSFPVLGLVGNSRAMTCYDYKVVDYEVVDYKVVDYEVVWNNCTRNENVDYKTAIITVIEVMFTRSNMYHCCTTLEFPIEFSM